MTWRGMDSTYLFPPKTHYKSSTSTIQPVKDCEENYGKHSDKLQFIGSTIQEFPVRTHFAVSTLLILMAFQLV